MPIRLRADSHRDPRRQPETRSIFDRYDIVSEKDLMAAAQRLSDHVNGPADVPQESAGKPIRERQSH